MIEESTTFSTPLFAALTERVKVAQLSQGPCMTPNGNDRKIHMLCARDKSNQAYRTDHATYAHIPSS